jgi:hypothetical protein
MSIGLVTFIIAIFEYVVALARGVDDVSQPEKVTVPAADMTQAYAIGQELRRLVQELVNQFDTIRWPSLSQASARQIVLAAASATTHFEQETYQLKPVSPGQTEVRSLTGGNATQWVQEMRLSQYFLEILVGERSTEVLQALSDQTWEYILTLTPVVGEAVLIYEAVVGQEAVGGRKLSSAERVAAGFAVILPHIISYSVKVAARAGAEVLIVTRRAVILALDDLKVYKLLTSARRLGKAVELAVALRALPESSFNELRSLLTLVRQGGALNVKQAARLNYFFLRMLDVSRLAQWLRIIDTELGSNVVGLQKLKNVNFKPGEEEALTLLTQHSGEPVVAVPEVLPIDYPSTAQYPGVTYPDGVWRGELFELRIPETSSIDQELRKIVSKQAQASRVVVALLQRSPLDRSVIEAALPRLWGNTYFCSISEIVIVDTKGFVVHPRPDPYIVPFMRGLLRAGLGNPKALAQIVEALQAEPPETAHP